MRIEAVEKMGYYPTPDRTEDILAEVINPCHQGLIRLFDPCAGEGKALRRLADALAAKGAKVATYGIEAQEGRAAKAAEVLDHVVSADLFCTNISYKVFQVALVNPPYDFAASQVDQKNRTERLELGFLRRVIPMLATDGLLIYIIPIHELTRDTAFLLARAFTQIGVYTLPGEEYSVYKQVVILATKRAKEVSAYETEQYLYQRAQDTQIIESYKAGGIDAERMEKITKTRDLSWFPKLDEASGVEVYLQVRAKANPRERVVMKQETIHPEQAIALYSEGGVHTTKEWKDLVEPPESYQITPPAPLKTGHIAGVMASGQIGITQIGSVILRGHTSRITEWRNAQGEVVGSESPDAEIETERIVPSVITLDLKTGQSQIIIDENDLATFLADHAKDLAEFVQSSCKPLYEGAIWRQWEIISRYALEKKYSGHPGGLSHSQKHVALATATLLQKRGYAFLIGEQGTGKTVMSPATVAYLQDIGAHALPAWILCPSHLVEKWQREVEQVVPGAKAIVAASITDLEAARAQYTNGQKLFVIVSKEMAKLGPGWEHAFITRKGEPCCPQCYEPYPKKPGKTKLFCAKCGAAMFTFAGLRRWPLADYARRKMKGFFKTLIADECHQYNGKSSDQARAYHHMKNATRYTINLTGTMMGGKASDIFWIFYKNSKKVREEFGYHDEARWAAQFGRLERIYRATTTTSGKLSGRSQTPSYVRELPGTSPALYRYVLESCIFLRVQDLGLPLPPYKEELILIDPPPSLGKQLDDADDAMKKVYGKRGRDVTQEEKENALRMLGVRTQIMLGRPNSAFRSEQIRWTPVGSTEKEPFYDSKNVPYMLDKLISDANPLLPKEAILVDEVKAQIEQGRKCLVYIRQTGSRDIQPRVENLLKQAGVRAIILPEGLEAKKREGWLRKNEDKIDVLIVNPRKVETGLDLVAFSTIYVYEPELSPYSLWQALRRIWRPGQTQDCKVKFLVYRNTMEHRAVTTLLRRMGSVLLLYGDEPGGALATLDEGNILMELTRSALKQLDGEPEPEDSEQLPDFSITTLDSAESVWLSLPAPTKETVKPVIHSIQESARLIWQAVLRPPKRKAPPAAQLSFLELFAAAD